MPTQLIDDPIHVVDEAIDGMLITYPHLRRVAGYRVVFDASRLDEFIRSKNVALISGGGSGHEPAHAGYVGNGMLSAAVCGDVFTSPAPKAILSAIKAVTGAAGCLLIVKNYTGDCFNFSLAAEQARADGLAVEIVIVGDDCAFTDAEDGRGRGIAGTVLVHKLAGALAAQGASLAEVAALAQRVASTVKTMGVGLSGCTIPAVGKPSFTLDEGEIEVGLGIHGEAGIKRLTYPPSKPHTNVASEVSAILCTAVMTAIRTCPVAAVSTSDYVVLVNGLGGTTALELSIVTKHTVALLSAAQFQIQRVIVGNLMTSLEMAGVSVSLLPVNSQWLQLLDTPVQAPGWPAMIGRPQMSDPVHIELSPATPQTATDAMTADSTASVTLAGIRAIANALLQHSDTLTQMDSFVGDGDMGISMARGCSAVLAVSEWLKMNTVAMLRHCGDILQESIGGSSGPLIAILLIRLAAHLQQHSVSSSSWRAAFSEAVRAVQAAGGAKVGDATMVDALAPAAEALLAEDGTASVRAASDAAKQGAQSTAQMHRRKGRGRYVGERALGHVDPGAHAVWLCFNALAELQ